MAARRLFLIFLLLALPARGEPVPGGEVRVERGPGALACPGEQELVQAALGLGAPPAARPGAAQEIFVRFDGDGAALRVLVRASGPKSGDRELRTEGPDCAKLAQATAVVVAVLLDLVPPEAVASFEDMAAAESVPAPGPSAGAAASQPPAPPPPRAPPPRAAPSTGSEFELAARAEGALALGLLGGAVSPVVGGSAALRRDAWEASLGGAWVAPRNVPFEDITGTSVELALAFGFGEACLRLTGTPASRWDTWLCGRVAAGLLEGRGRNFDTDSVSRELWLAAGPGVAGRLRLDRVLSLRFGLGGLLTLGRRTFVVDGYGEAYATPLVSAALSAGVELTIF
jgi:hypothetical protein